MKSIIYLAAITLTFAGCGNQSELFNSDLSNNSRDKNFVQPITAPLPQIFMNLLAGPGSKWNFLRETTTGEDRLKERTAVVTADFDQGSNQWNLGEGSTYKDGASSVSSWTYKNTRRGKIKMVFPTNEERTKTKVSYDTSGTVLYMVTNSKIAGNVPNKKDRIREVWAIGSHENSLLMKKTTYTYHSVDSINEFTITSFYRRNAHNLMVGGESDPFRDL
jgi:hypothetical protein